MSALLCLRTLIRKSYHIKINHHYRLTFIVGLIQGKESRTKKIHTRIKLYIKSENGRLADKSKTLHSQFFSPFRSYVLFLWSQGCMFMTQFKIINHSLFNTFFAFFINILRLIVTARDFVLGILNNGNFIFRLNIFVLPSIGV